MRNQQASWTAPSVEGMKLNCDASWVETSSTSGVAVVARNSKGLVTDGQTSIVTTSSPIEAELLAIQLAVDLAVRSFAGVQVEIETDCRVAYVFLTNPEPDVDWTLQLLVEGIRLDLMSLPNCVLYHTSRSNNRLADCLSKKCRLSTLPDDWVANPPPEVVNLILEDSYD